MTTSPLPARLLAGLVCLVLSSCSTTDFAAGPGSANERRAASYAAGGRHAEAAGVYIALASTASGADKDRLTLVTEVTKDDLKAAPDYKPNGQ